MVNVQVVKVDFLMSTDYPRHILMSIGQYFQPQLWRFIVVI